MALTTYAQLKAAVADWLDRRDLSDRIPDFIALAETRLNRLLRLRAMQVEVSLPAAAGEDRLLLPSDCLEPLALWHLVEGGRVALAFQSAGQRGSSDLSGRLRTWTVQGDGIRLDRPCETATRFGLDMVRAVRLSEAVATNPVLAACPDLYLFGTLMEAAPFLRDVELLNVFSARYAAALAEANALEGRPLGLSRLKPEAGLPC